MKKGIGLGKSFIQKFFKKGKLFEGWRKSGIKVGNKI